MAWGTAFSARWEDGQKFPTRAFRYYIDQEGASRLLKKDFGPHDGGICGRSQRGQTRRFSFNSITDLVSGVSATVGFEFFSSLLGAHSPASSP